MNAEKERWMDGWIERRREGKPFGHAYFGFLCIYKGGWMDGGMNR